MASLWHIQFARSGLCETRNKKNFRQRQQQIKMSEGEKKYPRAKKGLCNLRALN